MVNRRTYTALLSGALLLSSCSALRGHGLPAAAERCLAGPEAIREDVWGSFAVDVSSPDGEAELSIQAELTRHSSALVGFTPFGNRGMSIVQRHGEILSETNPSWRSPLSPEDLLLIFQIAIWPVEGLRGPLRVCGLEIREIPGPWAQREIRSGDNLVYRVDTFASDGAGPVHIVSLPGEGAIVRIHGPR